MNKQAPSPDKTQPKGTKKKLTMSSSHFHLACIKPRRVIVLLVWTIYSWLAQRNFPENSPLVSNCTNLQLK